jgi:hypothetical protein
MAIYGSGSLRRRNALHTKAIIFSANQMGERSRVLLFRASNKSDLFFNQSVLKQKRFFFPAKRVLYGFVIPDWNHAACGSVFRERRTNPDLPER